MNFSDESNGVPSGSLSAPTTQGSETFIHPLADCQSSDVGRGTRIWQFAVILNGARIGENCNICAHVFVESRAVVGHRVTVKCGVQLWNGVTLEDEVFVGPNATFSNDRYPRSGNHEFAELDTVVECGASIGAGAVILPGIRIGAGATVGAGAVVTGSVAPGITVVGNPARPLEHADGWPNMRNLAHRHEP